jgi:hypothetical protein
VKFVLTIAAALGGLLAAPLARAWAPAGQDMRVLGAGQPVSEVMAADGGAGLIHAAIDIPAPARTVWMVMNDCRFIKRLITSALSCRIVQGDAEHTGWDIKETVTKGNFLIPSIHNVYRSDYQPYSLIRFRKAGGDLKVEEGVWRLVSINNGAGTRVIYENLVAADLMLPAGLVREGMRRDTAKVLANLRSVTLSLGR